MIADRVTKPFAFVKFTTAEHAEAALRADQTFKGVRLTINLVINSSDQSLESNIFTKNVLADVTESQLMEEVSKIAGVTRV